MRSYDYEDALKMAGAEVICFERFGSYQGDWWAKVRFQGKEGWVNGSYGSCSGCDEIESLDNCWEDHPEESCPKCQGVLKQITAIGERDLESILTKDAAVKKASDGLELDLDAQEMVDYIKLEGRLPIKDKP